MPSSSKNKIEIRKTARQPVPSFPFLEAKNMVLGASYELSLAFIGNIQSRKLNRTFRNKDKVANVLSFPLGKNEGEIFINLSLAKKETKKFETTYRNMVGLFFIHGLLHLKGLDHGVTMDRLENNFRKKFKIKSIFEKEARR